MIRIDSGGPPPSFVPHGPHRPSYEERGLTAAERATLHSEQRGYCAYCEGPLRDVDTARGRHETRVEHFHPRHGARKSAECARQSGAGDLMAADLTWSNLLLCCAGKDPLGRPCCDVRKKATNICEDFWNPKTREVDRLVDVEPDGRLVPRSFLPADAQRVLDDVLGLNSPDFKRARRERSIAIKQRIEIEKRAHKYALTPARKHQIASGLRRQVAHGEVSYASVNLTLADKLDGTPKR